jgi:hypothetical protein
LSGDGAGEKGKERKKKREEREKQETLTRNRISRELCDEIFRARHLKGIYRHPG